MSVQHLFTYAAYQGYGRHRQGSLSERDALVRAAAAHGAGVASFVALPAAWRTGESVVPWSLVQSFWSRSLLVPSQPGQSSWRWSFGALAAWRRAWRGLDGQRPGASLCFVVRRWRNSGRVNPSPPPCLPRSHPHPVPLEEVD